MPLSLHRTPGKLDWPCVDAFRIETPRALFAAVAVSMAALTLSLLIVVPASLESSGADELTIAQPVAPLSPTPIERRT